MLSRISKARQMAKRHGPAYWREHIQNWVRSDLTQSEYPCGFWRLDAGKRRFPAPQAKTAARKRPFLPRRCVPAHFPDQPLTRFLYSAVRVSISILSPISQNSGTGNSKPVVILAVFITLPEVSPLIAGSV